MATPPEKEKYIAEVQLQSKPDWLLERSQLEEDAEDAEEERMMEDPFGYAARSCRRARCKRARTCQQRRMCANFEMRNVLAQAHNEERAAAKRASK